MDSTIDTGQTSTGLARTPNILLGDVLSRKFWRLDADKLCATAQRRTQLVDFGAPPLQPALSLLTDSLEREADLHPLGRFLLWVHFKDLLETRLKLNQLYKIRHDSSGSPTIDRPLFITGMPRSGSTFLHELLAQDPFNRVPRVWEVMFPVPPPGPQRLHDPRIKKAAACLWWFRRFAPQADSVFPMRANTPHECVAIHSYSFLSEEFISTCRVPTYESYLRHADLRPAYLWERRFLEHLQDGCPPRRWVLKSPDHAYGLDALFEAFPDALVIQTHRNPLDVLKSSSHLTEVLQGLYARPIPLAQIAARESHVLAGMLDRFMDFRDRHPQLADRFVDVSYAEIVSDPISVVRRIYQKFNLRFSAAAANQIRRLSATRARYGNDQGTARPPAVPLETNFDRTSFARYCSRFNVRWETRIK